MRSTTLILICCLYALSAVNAWSNDAKDDKDDNDDCASHSVAVLIGTSTYAIPCLRGDSIVNLNGLIPTSISSIASSSATETSSSAASSSEASSATDSITSTNSTTTTTDSTTTTDTTTSTDSSPTFTVTLYFSNDCTGGPLITSSNSGCFNLDLFSFPFSAATTSTAQLKVDSFLFPNCVGIPTFSTQISSGACGQDLFTAGPTLSYSVTTV